MNKELFMLGVSFRTAPAAVREALSFDNAQAASLIREVSNQVDGLEAAVLSTCNRSEFYLAAPAESLVVEKWLDALRRARPNAPILSSECLRYQLTGADAARHLFRVASGLDSAILGDVQITSQVKEAIETARKCGSLGRYLDRTFTHALRSGKRARTHTRIGYGAASLGSALAGIIAVRCASIHHAAPVPKILIIGAGEIARDIGRHLAKRALGDLIFVNRTKSKAKSLALECNGEFLPWSWLSQALFQVDIAIAATTAVEPVLSRALLDALATERSERSLLVVDAGLPRNVEPGSLVEVIGIDSIREQQKEVLDERRSAVPHVERIIDEELKAWEQWRASLPLERLIKDLYLGVAEHSREAARSFAMETGVAPVVAEQILLRSLKRMLHPHVRRMRSSK